MFRNIDILVPTDFSSYANYTIKYALALGKQFSGRLHFAHVLDASAFGDGSGGSVWLSETEFATLIDSMREHAMTRLSLLVQRAADQGIETQEHIAVGDPTRELLALIEKTGSTMVIIATHGRSGFEHLVFGSVAEKMVRQSPVPVLSIKHPEHEFVRDDDLRISIKRILFPTDFSPFSNKALPFAVSLAREFGATLVLFHATEAPVVLPEAVPDSAVNLVPEMERESRALVNQACEAITEVATEACVKVGLAHREICGYAAETHVDLIVMPTHGRSGLSHVLFGSVAEKVVRTARCPVMTIRPEWQTKK